MNDALTLTVSASWNSVPSAGDVIVTLGGTLPTVSVASALTGALNPSSAVSVIVYVPSSVHVIVVEIALGSANEHVAPASTPTSAT